MLGTPVSLVHNASMELDGTLKQMCYCTHRVTLLTAKHRKLRLQFAWGHQTCKTEIWKTLPFLKWHYTVWHESMDPISLISTAQVAGDVMVWGILTQDNSPCSTPQINFTNWFVEHENEFTPSLSVYLCLHRHQISIQESAFGMWLM